MIVAVAPTPVVPAPLAQQYPSPHSQRRQTCPELHRSNDRIVTPAALICCKHGAESTARLLHSLRGRRRFRGHEVAAGVERDDAGAGFRTPPTHQQRAYVHRANVRLRGHGDSDFNGNRGRAEPTWTFTATFGDGSSFTDEARDFICFTYGGNDTIKLEEIYVGVVSPGGGLKDTLELIKCRLTVRPLTLAEEDAFIPVIDGDDEITLRSSSGTVGGGDGNDTVTIFGDASDSQIDVFKGNDTVKIEAGAIFRNATVYLGEGERDTFTGAGILTGTRVSGQGGVDVIQCQNGRGGGGLRLEGGNEDDKIYGTPDNDIIVGGSGRDWLQGNGGNDYLNAKDGVEGNDVVIGGGDTDTAIIDYWSEDFVSGDTENVFYEDIIV